MTAVVWRIAMEAPAYAANDLSGMGGQADRWALE